MIGRVSIAVLVFLAVLVWMLADPPRQTAERLMPNSPKEQAYQYVAAPAKPMQMTTIVLPPPPEPAVETLVVTTLTPEILTVVPEPNRTVTPLKVAPKPRTTSRSYSPAPSPLQIEPVKPAPKPVAKPSKPAPKIMNPQPRLQANPIPATPAPSPSSKQQATEGRPLLKLLEHGKGPSVEIAWPASASLRRRLYDLFKQCYGMRIAVMDANGQLFNDASRPGQAWSINLDRYSGFMRQSSAGAALDEYRIVRQIRSRHGLDSATAVRLFPRHTDAVLLGGLRNLIGGNYDGTKRIQARYQISGSKVSVTDITIDAKPVTGSIELSSGAIRRCII